MPENSNTPPPINLGNQRKAAVALQHHAAVMKGYKQALNETSNQTAPNTQGNTLPSG